MIYGFQHICTIGNWEDVVLEQWQKIQDSGLYDWMQVLNCGVIGQRELNLTDEKIQVIHTSPKIEEYEFRTLAFLHNFCKGNRGARVFYIHTKGVSNPRNRSKQDWRCLMEYFIIEQFRLCLHELKKVDIVGINWREGPYKRITPHFSGNFWWARASYIASLPAPVGNSRFDAEFWIGKGNPWVAELFNSGIRHHAKIFPEDRYRDQEHRVKYFKVRDGKSCEIPKNTN